MKNFSYFEPRELGAALALLAEYQGRVKILAGGTELVPQMKRGLSAPEAVLSLGGLASLKEMAEDAGELRIGAMVSLGSLEQSSLLASGYAALKEAAGRVAVRPIRNAGTIGGNACLDTKCIYRDQSQTWERALPPCYKSGGSRCYVVRGGKGCHASLAADTVPALIALQAKGKVLFSGGEKTVAIESLYTGNGIRPIALGPQELLTEILLPRSQAGSGSAYFRFSHRQAIDFPVASAAVWLRGEAKMCAEVRVVLGAIAPGPVRLPQVEAALKGQIVTADLLRQCSQKAPEEALQSSKSGRIDGLARGLIASLVFQALNKVWQGLS